MKVVVTGTRGIPNILGGVETHCENLYPYIAEEKDIDVTIVRRSSYIALNNKISKYNGVSLKDIYSPKKKSFEAIIHTFLAILYAFFKRAKIVHIHAIGPALMIPFARLLGLKVVFTHHGADYNRQKWGRFAKIMLQTGEKFGAKYANETIVISKVIQSDLKKLYNVEVNNLIPNGVTVQKVSSKTDYIESLGLEKKSYIIAVARFVPEKGFHDLIDAYLNIITDKKLVLVGDADHESQYSLGLKKKAKENNIILTGFIKGEKLNQIFSNASLFVMPSYHEGLPIALLEAMSYNLNVLVSDIPANLEVELSSENYFKVGDVNELSEKLKYKLDNYSSFNYSTIIEKKYNWSLIAKKTIEVYNNLR